MRDPKRIDTVLAALKSYWEANPDLRLGQIVSNASYRANGPDQDIFFLEEGDLLHGLEKLQTSE